MSSNAQSPFSLFDSGNQSPQVLVDQILGNISGIQIDPGSIRYFGPSGSTSLFQSVDFGNIGQQSFRLDSPGILITTGDGAPPLANTYISHTVDHGAPGDEMLSQIALQAFPFAGETYDAVILEFSFTVTNPQVKGISFDVMFGSEEFPVYVDSEYVDIAAITVNGTNIAYIDGDVTKPLSIVGATVGDGRFYSNMGSGWSGEDDDEDLDFGDMFLSSSPLAIEYNGITPRLMIPTGLDPALTVHTVRIGIADTGDHILDSGLFITNFRALGSEFSGPLVVVEAPPQGGELIPASPVTPTYFQGGAGNDVMNGSTGADIYDLTQGGFNIIQGSLEQLKNDLVIGFSSNDAIMVLGSFFTTEQLTVTQGSAILDIDANNDGQSDATITLQGDFSTGQFVVSGGSNGSSITFNPGVGRPAHYGVEERIMEIYSSVWGAVPDREGLEYWVNEINQGHLTYENTVRSFFDQPLVQVRYEGKQGDALILALYQNIFRIPEPDEAGLAYWRQQVTDDPALLGNDIGRLVMMMIDGMWSNDHILAMNAQSLFKNFVTAGHGFLEGQSERQIPVLSQTDTSFRETFLDAARQLTEGLTAGTTAIDMEGMINTALDRISTAMPADAQQQNLLWAFEGDFSSEEFGGDPAHADDAIVGGAFIDLAGVNVSDWIPA